MLLFLFLFVFCSAAGKWPHDKGWSLPLCSMQHLFIHIFIGGAFSPHFSGAPLQYEGNPLILVGWEALMLHLLHIIWTCKFQKLPCKGRFWLEVRGADWLDFAGVQSAAETFLPRQSRNHHREAEASFWNLLGGNCNLLYQADETLWTDTLPVDFHLGTLEPWALNVKKKRHRDWK